MGKRIVQRLFGTPLPVPLLPVPLLQRRRHRPAYVFLDHIGCRTLRLLAATALTKPAPHPWVWQPLTAEKGVAVLGKIRNTCANRDNSRRAIEAVIDQNGILRVLEPIPWPKYRRVLVTILNEEPSEELDNLARMSEVALARDWDNPEEDESWSHLAQLPSW